MRPRAAALLLGLTLSASSFLASMAWAQTGSPQAAAGQVQPIGKIESASGSVTVTHADGVVLQANVGPNGGLGQAKVGDLVYRGDLVETGTNSAVGDAPNPMAEPMGNSMVTWGSGRATSP